MRVNTSTATGLSLGTAQSSLLSFLIGLESIADRLNSGLGLETAPGTFQYPGPEEVLPQLRHIVAVAFLPR